MDYKNEDCTEVVVEKVKKGRGRPKGTVKAETLAEQRIYAERQWNKLQARLTCLNDEIGLVNEKMDKFKHIMSA